MNINIKENWKDYLDDCVSDYDRYHILMLVFVDPEINLGREKEFLKKYTHIINMMKEDSDKRIKNKNRKIIW